MKGLIIIAALLLTGCGDFVSPGKAANEHERTNYNLAYVTMDDGMPCVKYMYKGGLSCDWDYKTRVKPKLIKFYTIPGYSCDTTEIPGHCSNLNITQAEYDKKNSHLFKVTR